MTNDQDGEVGRTIVGPVMVKIFAADRAGIPHLEIAAEERPGAAIRATPPPAAQKRGTKRAVFGILGQRRFGHHRHSGLAVGQRQ